MSIKRCHIRDGKSIISYVGDCFLQNMGGGHIGKMIILILSNSEENIIEKIKTALNEYTISSEIVYLENSPICFKRIKIFPQQRLAYLDNAELMLTAKEFDLLYYFACHNKQVFTIKQLYEGITKEKYIDTYKSLESSIYRLRKKVGADLIVNVRGYGYKFCAE